MSVLIKIDDAMLLREIRSDAQTSFSAHLAMKHTPVSLAILCCAVFAPIAIGYYYIAASPAAIVRGVVKWHLNDPDSAQFRNLIPSRRDDEVWCGEVNARNRMGGMVGFTRFVAYVRRKNEPASILNEVFFEQMRFSREPTSPSAAFASKWSMFCT